MKSPWEIVKRVSGGLKTAKASMDASFALRQGFVTLITKPQIWADNFAHSFNAWKLELRGIDGAAPVKAEVFSRRNAVNGNYRKLGVDIGIDTEEAMPESWPTKIPLLGRLYKASMSAYNTALMRMRADLADRFIADAESMGVKNLKESGLGVLINSMTGRGRVPMTKGASDTVNATIFSIRYFKAQIDTLTAGATDPKIRGTPAQKVAAMNLLRIIATVGGVLGIAKLLDDDSVSFEPRSAKFGRIYVPVGNKRIGIDVTAGFRSLIILASRLTPTMRNGRWGLWWVSSKGKYSNMWDKRYGSMEPSDFLVNFMEGKASPFARAGLNLYKQQRWDREKPTLKTELFDLFSPISLTNATETAKEAGGENLIAALILSGLNMLGVSTTHDKKRR
jgi:hypothetical protein